MMYLKATLVSAASAALLITATAQADWLDSVRETLHDVRGAIADGKATAKDANDVYEELDGMPGTSAGSSAATPSTGDQAPAAKPSGNQVVARIQGCLNKVGYDAGPVDGMMGEKTKMAITLFEMDHDMPVTGSPSSDVLIAACR